MGMTLTKRCSTLGQSSSTRAATAEPPAVTMAVWKGGCHCGAIGFEYRSELAPSDWSIRACQCSFCRKHDALSTSEPGADLSFSAADPEQLQRYRFGLKTADFLLCRECGVYIGAVIETERGRFGIINTHALVETPADIADVAPISYDAEDTSGRVSRREERWSAVSAVPW